MALPLLDRQRWLSLRWPHAWLWQQLDLANFLYLFGLQPLLYLRWQQLFL